MRLFSKSKRIKKRQLFIVVCVIAPLFFLGYQSCIYSAQDAAFWKLADRRYILGQERSEYFQKISSGNAGRFLDSLIYRCIPPDSYSLTALEVSSEDLEEDVALYKQLRQPVELTICESNVINLNSLNEITNLVSLELLILPEILDLNDIGTCPNIRLLKIYDCPNLQKLEGLAGCAELTEIRISTCSQLTDLTVLNEHPHLKKVDLINLPKLTTFTPSSKLANLESLHIYDSPNLDFNPDEWRAVCPNLEIMDLR